MVAMRNKVQKQQQSYMRLCCNPPLTLYRVLTNHARLGGFICSSSPVSHGS